MKLGYITFKILLLLPEYNLVKYVISFQKLINICLKLCPSDYSTPPVGELIKTLLLEFPFKFCNKCEVIEYYTSFPDKKTYFAWKITILCPFTEKTTFYVKKLLREKRREQS